MGVVMATQPFLRPGLASYRFNSCIHFFYLLSLLFLGGKIPDVGCIYCIREAAVQHPFLLLCCWMCKRISTTQPSIAGAQSIPAPALGVMFFSAHNSQREAEQFTSVLGKTPFNQKPNAGSHLRADSRCCC